MAWPSCLALKKVDTKVNKMNKESKRKRRENFKYDEKIDIVKVHYFEGVSLKELARIYNTESSVITRIISTFAATKERNTEKRTKKNRKSIARMLIDSY